MKTLPFIAMLCMPIMALSINGLPPFSYKDVALGMSKEEVIQLARQLHGVIPDCFDLGERYQRKEWKDVGVHVCILRNDGPVTGKITIARVPAGLVRYRFYKGKLFEIHVRFAYGTVNGQPTSRENEYEAVLHAYTEKYGKPQSVETELFEDSAMSIFLKDAKPTKASRKIHLWRYGGQVMRIMQREDKSLLSSASISIEESETLKLVNRKLEEVSRPKTPSNGGSDI